MPQGCNTDQHRSWESIHVCILMGRGKQKQVFLWEHSFCEPQVNWATKVSTAFAPNSSSSNWLLLLELQKTQPPHLVHTEETSMYSQKGEQAYDLRAWFASYTRALCSGALENSAGEIPDCSLSNEKLRISVFGGLQPTPTWLNPLFSVKCLICQ